MAGKKPKLSVLSDSDEAALGKLSRKERAKAVSGKPDKTDVENLVRLFDTYDRVTGGRLRKMVDQNRLERALNHKGSEQPVETAGNLSFFLPGDLLEEVEKYWPTLWTNKDHLRWFLKTFPMFRR
jgi:hypothetical protein